MGLVCLLLCKEESSSPVSAITERRDMGLYEVPLSVSFVGFWVRDYVSQLPYVCYYVGVKSSFPHAREECESKECLRVLGTYCLICQDLVSCYFYFVLLPVGLELW